MEQVDGELLLCCVAGRYWVAHHLTISADTGQHGLLSYCSDLGLTGGVACRTIQTVYLVIQDAQISYQWSFLRGEDGSCGLIWHDIGAAGARICM